MLRNKKWRLVRGFVWTVLHTLARVAARTPRMTVLVYHSVSDAEDFFAVTPKAFKQHVSYMKAHADVVPLSKAFAVARGEVLTRDSIAITFDDGYQDFVTTILPVLEEEGVPATVFVLGENPHSSELGTSTPLLSIEEVEKLATNNLVSVQSHALTHRKLSRLTTDELLEEVKGARSYLQEITSVFPAYLAYPKGAFNKNVQAALVDAGFEGAVSVIERGVRNGDDQYALPRVQIDATTTPSLFKAKLTPAVDWYYALWRLSKRFRG